MTVPLERSVNPSSDYEPISETPGVFENRVFDNPRESAGVTHWLGEELAGLERAGLRRHRRAVTPLPHGECEVDGRRMINFASNDYLGLAGDPRLREAARTVIDEIGVGAGASALICGRSPWHERLEKQLAEFEQTEAALLFPTGYAANIGAISALAGRGDVICSDQLNHASLIDGCRLSRATVCVYPHGDVGQLADHLERHREARRRLIVTDGVFSMDGDLAPLNELMRLAEEFDAILLVDEAHGTGVLGEQGRGACELLGVESPNLVRVGTLSKAVGTVGGFVSGSCDMVDFLWNRARTQIFSTALPPAMCAAACAALDVIRDEPARRQHVHALARQLRDALADAGVPVLFAAETPILPVVIGDASEAMRISESLARQGMFVPAIRPPTVPEGTSRLRITLSAAHSAEATDRLANRLIGAQSS